MFTRLRNTLEYLRFYRVHRGTLESIRAWQEKHLIELLPRLQKKIPLYRDLLKANGVSSSDVQSLADLKRLPILSKKDFEGRFVEEYVDRSESSRGTWAVTNGKNGARIPVLRRPHLNTPLYFDSLMYRFVLWREPWRLHTEWLKVVHIQDHIQEVGNHIGIETGYFEKNNEAAIKRIVDFRPDLIESYPSTLLEFARSHRKEMPRIKLAVLTGEPVHETTRIEIEKCLGTEVYVRYDVKAFGAIAVECREHQGLHINVESFIVEILDNKGKALPAGEVGRVVVTDLLNLQMPSVRYDTEDRGYVSEETCVCGLACPRLWISPQ